MLPEVRLDNDSFKALIEEYRMQIAGIYPEWTNYNYSDPGMTLVELFAWMKENQQFFMEQLSPEHYRSFFRLMGLSQQQRRPAVVIACVREGSDRKEEIIPRGTVYYTEGIPYSAMRETVIPDIRICGIKAGVYITDDQLDAFGTVNAYPFGKKAKHGETMEIFLDRPLPAGRECLLAVIIKNSPARNTIGKFPFRELTRLRYEYYTQEGWKEIDNIRDNTRGFLHTGTVSMTAEEPMAETEDGRYAIRITFAGGTYDRTPFITNMGFNMLMLVQQTEIDGASHPEGVYLGEGNGFPSQRMHIPYDGVMSNTVEIMAEDILSPGTLKAWKRVDDFSNEGPASECFAVDELTGDILFGDGIRGLPPEGKVVLTKAGLSLGFAGTAMDGTVLSAAGHRDLKVISTMTVGCDTETLEEMKIRAKAGKENTALSTASDYERQVLLTPGMVISSCRVLEKLSSPTRVTIAVRPGDGEELLKLSDEMTENIHMHLDGRRLIGTDVKLMSPEYIRVNTEVHLLPSDASGDFEKTVRDAVRKYFEEYGSFGDSIIYGKLYGIIDGLDCVERLYAITFETDKVSVMKNTGGDLIPPANGLFMCNGVNVVYR